jgi:phosphoribosylformylglycinamidine synthase PurS subunit
MYTAEVRVSLKKGVADPEGTNTRKALELLGFDDVKDVKSQKVFVINMDAADEQIAHQKAEEMVKRLLANPVIHNYDIKVTAADTAGGAGTGAGPV